jgi:hypothetical protein
MRGTRGSGNCAAVGKGYLNAQNCGFSVGPAIDVPDPRGEAAPREKYDMAPVSWPRVKRILAVGSEQNVFASGGPEKPENRMKIPLRWPELVQRCSKLAQKEGRPVLRGLTYTSTWRDGRRAYRLRSDDRGRRRGCRRPPSPRRQVRGRAEGYRRRVAAIRHFGWSIKLTLGLSAFLPVPHRCSLRGSAASLAG